MGTVYGAAFNPGHLEASYFSGDVSFGGVLRLYSIGLDPDVDYATTFQYEVPFVIREASANWRTGSLLLSEVDWRLAYDKHSALTK